MFFLRRALQLWPFPARFFVLALALLQFVAPTWHICELGGHVLAHDAAHQNHGTGHSSDVFSRSLLWGQSDASNAQKPLICFCAAHPKPVDTNAPHLDGVVSHLHPTCLALLLQTLPGAIAAPHAIRRDFAVLAAPFAPLREIAPQIAVLRRFRGRAPPWSV